MADSAPTGPPAVMRRTTVDRDDRTGDMRGPAPTRGKRHEIGALLGRADRAGFLGISSRQRAAIAELGLSGRAQHRLHALGADEAGIAGDDADLVDEAGCRPCRG